MAAGDGQMLSVDTRSGKTVGHRSSMAYARGRVLPSPTEAGEVRCDSGTVPPL
jgi:hypothetical protein